MAGRRAGSTFFHDLVDVIRCDWLLLRRHPKLRLSAFGVCFIPAIYAVIYIASLWDPTAMAPHLPVLIVNHDAGTVFEQQTIEVGKALADKLKKDKKLGFSDEPDEARALEAVRRGDADFALLIPANFSELAVRGQQSGAGVLTVYVSEGNNYTGANVARKFAPEVTRKLNELLAEKRWSKVAAIAADSRLKIAKLKDGVTQLRDGSTQLREGLDKASAGAEKLTAGLAKADQAGGQLKAGAGKLDDASQKLVTGMKQLGGGIAQMNDKLPANSDLQKLQDGSIALADGQQKLNAGLVKLHDGSGRLVDGLDQLRTKSADIPIWGGKVSDGALRLEHGAKQINTGLEQAREGSGKLADGSEQLKGGVVALTNGVMKLGDGIRLMHSKMPPADKLDEYAEGMHKLANGNGQLANGLTALHTGSGQLNEGLKKLDDGATRLEAGLKTLDEAVPANLNIPDINPEGYASSVKTDIQVVAPVPNNGSAFATNFVPLSLWVGAVMTSFLFHYRKIPVRVQHHNRWAKTLGKMLIPILIAFFQVQIMLIALWIVLGIKAQSPLLLAFTLLSASAAFITIVMALVRWLGDTGKVIAVLFLILQLSASGAIIPIELSGQFFQDIHPWLPFTYAVAAIKVALFGAYDGRWLPQWLGLMAGPAVLLPVIVYLGPWKPQPDAQYRPALDID